MFAGMHVLSSALPCMLHACGKKIHCKLVCDSSSTTASSDEHQQWPIYVMLCSIMVAKAVPAKKNCWSAQSAQCLAQLLQRMAWRLLIVGLQ